MIKTTSVVGEVGINKDIQPHELKDNAWSDGSNVRFRNGAMERMKGQQRVFDVPAVTPYWLQPYNVANKRYWIHAGIAAVYADEGAGRTDITPASAPTGTIDNRWTGGVLNGVLLMNNGVNNPYYWGGTGVLAAMPNWPASTTCASLRPFKNVAVALDVTKSGTRYAHMVKWSDVADPGTVPQSWDETDKTKLAGELELAEESSLLVDQLPLGDVNIIYKQNAMYAMRASGGLSVFDFQRLPGSEGLLARGCVCNTPIGHVVLTNGDVVIHSGQGPKSILTGIMRQWLFRTIDSGSNRDRSFVVANPAAKEVWICFPQLGDATCTLAVVWNWEDRTTSIRSLANVTYGAVGQLEAIATQAWSAQAYAWQDAAQAWNEDELSPAQDRLLISTTAPSIAAADVTGTNEGAAYTSYAERMGLTFGDASRVKTVKGLRVRLDASLGTRVQFEVGGRMNSNDATTWSAPVEFEVGVTQNNQLDLFATGKLIDLRVTSVDNQPWRFTSYDSDFVVGGFY